MKIVIVGFGSIGQGLAPLLRKHLPFVEVVEVVTADDRGRAIAEAYGFDFEVNALTPDNFQAVMEAKLAQGDLMINVSVDVSSHDLIDWCQDKGVLYIDTCIEPWAGGYHLADKKKTTNYYQRERVLALRKKKRTSTALIAHGANPGLVTHFVKRALDELTYALHMVDAPYPEKAAYLGIRQIHIAERDTQTDGKPLREGEFVNTWSVDGLLSEGFQNAEFGWGSHELGLSKYATPHHRVRNASGYIDRPSAEVKIKSWVPSVGEQEAYLITHHEAMSISAWLTTRKHGEVTYRPSTYYAYHPSDKTCQSLENWKASGYKEPAIKTLLTADQIIDGYDELGVLLTNDFGHSYWYGSTLTNEHARSMVPHNSATTLQVTATMIAAIQHMIANPELGIVEAEDIDLHGELSVLSSYFGNVRGVHGGWYASSLMRDYLINP